MRTYEILLGGSHLMLGVELPPRDDGEYRRMPLYRLLPHGRELTSERYPGFDRFTDFESTDVGDLTEAELRDRYGPILPTPPDTLPLESADPKSSGETWEDVARANIDGDNAPGIALGMYPPEEPESAGWEWYESKLRQRREKRDGRI